MYCTDNKTIKLSDVREINQGGGEKYYSAILSARDIYYMQDRLSYEHEAQRGMINGKPAINKEHVQEIYSSLLNGDKLKGHLTWNMRKESSDSFVFKSSSLEILENQKITIPDSAHRHEAIIKLLDTHPNSDFWDDEYLVDIYNLTFEGEKELFYTINGKSKPPTRNRVLYLSNTEESEFVRKLIRQSNLNGRVECVKSVTGSGKLTKFSTLYDTLFGAEGQFKVEYKTKNKDDLLKYLIKFYNSLLSSREEFDVIQESAKKEEKEKSMVLQELSWWGYAWLAKELMNSGNLGKALKSRMNKKINVQGGESIDFFNKANPIWHASVIAPKYNFITGKQEIGTKVINSNATRRAVIKVFQLSFI